MPGVLYGAESASSFMRYRSRGRSWPFESYFRIPCHALNFKFLVLPFLQPYPLTCFSPRRKGLALVLKPLLILLGDNLPVSASANVACLPVNSFRIGAASFAATKGISSVLVLLGSEIMQALLLVS